MTVYGRLKRKNNRKKADEVVAAMKNVATAVKSIQPKEDSELKALLAQSKEAITAFVKATQNAKPAEVFPTDALQKIDNIAKQIGTILNGIDTRLHALEQRPLATKLKAERNQYSNEIEYITIEYKN